MTRYCPHLKLPDYRYIPGKMPKDENRKDLPKIKIKNLPASEWKKNEAYLYGIDLFLHDFFYEAHEIWEELWMKVGRESTQGKFLKALIQLAAAKLKLSTGETKPAERLNLKAKELLQLVFYSGKCDEDGNYMGFSVLFREFGNPRDE